MLAVVSWQCDCGMRVKVMYETDGLTRIRCPATFCQITHIVEGKITELWWIKDDRAGWQERQFSDLMVQ